MKKTWLKYVLMSLLIILNVIFFFVATQRENALVVVFVAAVIAIWYMINTLYKYHNKFVKMYHVIQSLILFIVFTLMTLNAVEINVLKRTIITHTQTFNQMENSPEKEALRDLIFELHDAMRFETRLLYVYMGILIVIFIIHLIVLYRHDFKQYEKNQLK